MKTSRPNVEDGGVVRAIGADAVGKMTGENVTGRLEKLGNTTDVSPTSKIGEEDVTAIRHIIELNHSKVKSTLHFRRYFDLHYCYFNKYMLF